MRISSFLLFFCLSILLSSCDLVGDILEFGFWTGVIGIILIVLLVGWLVKRFRR